MRRIGFLAVAALGALVLAVPSLAQSTQEFRAEFHDSSSPTCPPSVGDCGKGVVKGFGTVTTTLTFTSLAPGPGANCVTGTADRVVTLDSNGSTLLLALAGTICNQKISGTFTIAGGTGTFEQASGGGTISGVAIPGAPGDTVHFRGSITLP